MPLTGTNKARVHFWESAQVTLLSWSFFLPGIAHRDLKLENILLTRKNDPVVTDFGFARFVNSDVLPQRRRSRTFCGSFAYASPEILSGGYARMRGEYWSLNIGWDINAPKYHLPTF